MEETKFNNLCSHYKDTSDIQQATIKQRDTLFYRLLVILAVFTLQLSSTDMVSGIVSDYINKATGITANFCTQSLCGHCVVYLPLRRQEQLYSWLH
jgi:hypothetical protein